MKRFCRFSPLFLRFAALCVLAALFFCVPAQALSGSDFTDDETLAQKLDAVFTGKARLFSNTKKGYPLDSYMGNATFYIDGRVGGSQCYIYANAVYFYLFGEIPYHGEGPYEYSYVALVGLKEVGYDDFIAAGIGTGTYIRTTDKKDASYNGDKGHSLIVLGYDTKSISWLDANWGSRRYYVHAHTESWEYFNEKMLNSRRICHAVVPYRTSGRYVLLAGDGTVYDLDALGLTDILIIPESVASVGSGAFAGAPAQGIVVPASVGDIGEDAFGSAVIFGFEGSRAELYAQYNALLFLPICEGWWLSK